MTPGERVRAAVRAAVASLDPARLVASDLGASPFPLVAPARLLSLGKSALPAARGAIAAGAAPAAAVVVAPAADLAADPGGWPAGWTLLPGDHPIPGPRSFAAGEALAALAAGDPEAPLLALVSGGGSALAESPRPPLLPTDLELLGNLLLRSGRSIDGINAARRALSSIKGGGLLAPRRGPVRTLLFSDVGDHDPAVVASGPTLPPPAAGERADWLAASAREAGLPPALLDRLDAALRSAVPVSSSSVVSEARLLASPADLARATARELTGAGLSVAIVERNLDASAAEFAARLAGAALSVPAGAAAVLVGEPTLRLPPSAPAGGRAAHVLLLATLLVARGPLSPDGDPLLFGVGSDGVDGTDGGAGALVEPHLLAHLRLDPAPASAALDRFASADWLREQGARLPAEPSGVNLRDVFVVARPARCDNLPGR